MSGQHAGTLDRKTLMSLVDASRAIISELELDEVFKRVAEHAAAVLNATGASVLLYDEQRHELVFQAAVGPGAAQLMGERFDADQGIAGQALRTGRAMRVDDARQNRHFFDGIDAKTHMRTQSLLAAPLSHKERVVGVVEVLNPLDRDTFTAGDLELLQVFANMAAAAAFNAQAYERVARQNRALRESLPKHHLVGRAPAIMEVMRLCRKVAPSNATVLLYGETGTGKEVAARLIHDSSDRHDRPFIAVNCAALPETLLESELFGHEKGAFTGASAQKFGRFELADGGTLFLDEISELTPAIQVKLLRVLEEREFVRVGGTQTISCDVRIVAATNRDLKQEIGTGRFRDDLYYRLNVFPITLPPLRERIDDLELLVDHFVQQVAPNLAIEPPEVTRATLRCLMNYRWPGNIRELRNVIERATLLATEGRITPECLPAELLEGVEDQKPETGPEANPGAEARAETGAEPGNGDGPTGRSTLAENERALILKALDQTNWNQSAAARHLGVSRDHLRYRIKKYGLRSRSVGSTAPNYPGQPQ